MKKEESIKVKVNTFTKLKNRHLSSVIKYSNNSNKELGEENKDKENNLYSSLYIQYSSDNFFNNRIKEIEISNISKTFSELEKFNNTKINNYFDLIILLSITDYNCIDPKFIRFLILIIPLFNKSLPEEILSFTKYLIDKKLQNNSK